MQRLFSGIQPTGNIHLGNYLGAIKNWVKLQNDFDSIFCIVDLHAITVFQNPESLREATFNTVAAYIACGIDYKKHIIFHQSSVQEHTELTWLLSSITPLGWLNRMTQFKEKAGKHQDKSNLGLYSYPVLMAADILLYNTDIVPVGEDQKQHLELTRDIAGAFNRLYNMEYFKLPEPLIPKESARIMSLRDGTKKMSKSDESDYSRINLSDDNDTIEKKIKKAKTDSFTEISYNLENRPEVTNFINIYCSLTGKTPKEIVEKFIGQNFSEFKKEITDLLISEIEPIRTEITNLKQDKGELYKILQQGSDKARNIASHSLLQIKEIIGFLKS